MSKKEIKEMGADCSGSVESPIGKVIKKGKVGEIKNSKKYKSQEIEEVTDASSSGQFDVPLFGGTKGRKNPLSIDGEKSIGQSRAVKDKNFPKWGGPQSTFVKIKNKCKKFPYCTQGDINAIETLREAIESTSKEYGLSKEQVEKIVINEIKRIFI